MRTIQSPGVEITERDYTQTAVYPVGTNIFVTGYTPKGPTDDVLQITTVAELEQIYGIPTTPAERYFYYTCREILQDSPSNLFVSRLPYGDNLGDGFGNTYGALVFPAKTLTSPGSGYSTNFAISAGTYLLGAPKFFELTKSQYLSVLDGTAFTWSASGGNITGVSEFGNAGLIILNPSQSTTDTRGQGYYVGLTDNANADPSSNHDSFNSIVTVSQSAASAGISNFTTIPTSRLYFSLSATNDTGTSRDNSNMSLSLEKAFYQYADATTRKFDDILAVGVYKLRTSPYTPDVTKLEYVSQESYLGSLDYNRKIQDSSTGNAVSYYLPAQSINSTSVKLLINDNINSRMGDTWLDYNGTPLKKVRIVSHSAINALTNNPALSSVYGGTAADFNTAAGDIGYGDAVYPTGGYTNLNFTNKSIGSMPLKIDRVLSKIENDEIFDLDVICEAGLGTIYAACQATGTTFYDDTVISSGMLEGLNALVSSTDYVSPSGTNDLRGSYQNIWSRFDTFASQQRKDCVFISDPIRHIFIRGENSKVLADPTRSFSQYIYNPLRHNFELCNSSYSTTYGNWAQVNDPFAGINVWVPFSGWAAAAFANTDANFQPWFAPAGSTRGLVRNVQALAITPSQKQRDQLYKISVNPVAFFPSDGFVIEGQKTLLKQPSSFDRINYRRLFLYLEKAVKKTSRRFVFEPNTLFTRTRVINTLKPIFDLAKNSEGLYDYIIVCDKRNNTPDVIDRKELKIDIYLKGVQAGEFVLVGFNATPTGTSFSELIAGPRF